MIQNETTSHRFKTNTSLDIKSLSSYQNKLEANQKESLDQYQTIKTEKKSHTRTLKKSSRFHHISPYDFSTPNSSASKIIDIEFASAKNIAIELFDAVIDHEPSLKNISALIYKASSIGKVKALRCVFESGAMNDIIAHKSNYLTINDYLDAMTRNKSKLINCLGFSNKLRYGPSISSLIKLFGEQKPLLSKIGAIYGRHRNISEGTAICDLMSFFFRPDALDSKALSIFSSMTQQILTHNK